MPPTRPVEEVRIVLSTEDFGEDVPKNRALFEVRTYTVDGVLCGGACRPHGNHLVAELLLDEAVAPGVGGAWSFRGENRPAHAIKLTKG
jgi:hypothetical protein